MLVSHFMLFSSAQVFWFRYAAERNDTLVVYFPSSRFGEVPLLFLAPLLAIIAIVAFGFISASSFASLRLVYRGALS